MNTRSSKLSLAAILDTSIGRLHVFPTVIMTVHLQPPMEFAVPCLGLVDVAGPLVGLVSCGRSGTSDVTS